MSSVSGLNSVLSSAAATSTSSAASNISSILAAANGVATPGIDVGAAVAAALYADRASERGWQSEQTTLSSQSTGLTAIQNATNALNTDLQSLNSLNGPLSARAVSSSDPLALTAVAAAGTVTGNHVVVVNSLASTGSWYSDLAPSATATLPAESFTISTTGGASATIHVGTGGINSLTDIAGDINGQNLGLTASVVSDSTGSRLSIVSNTSGSAGDFNIVSAPTTTTSWSSPSVASSSAGLSASSFTIGFGSNPPTTISVTSGETLSQIATNVNSQNLGVNASVVQDSSGYHLSILSANQANPFTISLPTFGFSQAAAGANASLSVDGVPISSASNTVTGAIGGVTLNLYNATAGAQVDLSVGSDGGQVSTAIQSLATDYNKALALVNSQFTYDAASNSQGALGSDPIVRELQSTLLQAVSYTSTGSNTITSLSSLGITTNDDGTLTVDTAALSTAVTNSPVDIQSFFQGSALNGFASSVQNQLTSFTDPGNGAFTVDLNGISAESKDVANEISNFETNYIANQQTVLTAEYSKAEIALQQLPTLTAQINAELGNNKSSS